MQESNLFKIALICSLAGIFILLMISEHLEPELTKISEIELSKDQDKVVKINGEITKVTILTGLTIINIKDQTGEIPAVFFEEKPELQACKFIEVTGGITDYKEKPEIIINTLKCL